MRRAVAAALPMFYHTMIFVGRLRNPITCHEQLRIHQSGRTPLASPAGQDARCERPARAEESVPLRSMCKLRRGIDRDGARFLPYSIVGVPASEATGESLTQNEPSPDMRIARLVDEISRYPSTHPSLPVTPPCITVRSSAPASGPGAVGGRGGLRRPGRRDHRGGGPGGDGRRGELRRSLSGRYRPDRALGVRGASRPGAYDLR